MKPTLRLTGEEQAMLDGEGGPGLRKAMEILTALGNIYGAQDLVPVSSAQVSGVSYKNLGDAGLEFLREWAAQGARARVPATLNPAGMDRLAWAELGFSAEFAQRQQAVVTAYQDLGLVPTCTCTPYLIGFLPQRSEHLAWAESSAVSYANSVLGARTNREGGPSALAAAIAGRTPRYGLHLDQNRRPTLEVDVQCPIHSEADLGALGYLVGRLAKNGVPLLRFQRQQPRTSELKALGAAMAASGAVALYHIEGLTPEALDLAPLASGVERIKIEDLSPAHAALNTGVTDIDLVSIGCPHASLQELDVVAGLLDGRRVRTALWITTARVTRQAAEAACLVERLEAAGARVVADTCMVVAPVAELGFRTMATNSAKMALYAPSHSGLQVRFGSLPKCIEAALTGRWGSEKGFSP